MGQETVGIYAALNLRQRSGLCQMRGRIVGSLGGVEKKDPHRHIVDKSRQGPSYSQRGEPYVHPNQLFY